jgi:mannitol-specific phosphotransferase system IIBC component
MAWAAAVVAFVGAMVQGRQEANEARAAAKVEEYKANVTEMNARAVGQQASAEEERVRREARQLQGQQRAAIAQSGTGFGGSNADVMRQDMALAELDALNVQYAGDIERRGLLQEAEMFRYNGRQLRSKAKSVMRQRWISAISSGMSAYGQAGGGFGGGGGSG